MPDGIDYRLTQECLPDFPDVLLDVYAVQSVCLTMCAVNVTLNMNCI